MTVAYPPPGALALVTGASSGIGETFARALAARGLHLILTARSEDRLRALAAELTARHGVRVEVVPLDLAERGAPDRLFAETERLGLSPDLLVNNAGLGVLGPFAEVPLERHLELLRLNVEGLAALARLYLPAMLARRAGGIVNLSSMAGTLPIPYFATYAASKAFVTSFSRALRLECRGTGVRVVAVCPGPVGETRFGERAGLSPAGIAAWRGESRAAVVGAALRGLAGDRPLAIPGALNRVGARLIPLVPRRLQLAVSEALFRPRGGGPASTRAGTPTATRSIGAGAFGIGRGTRALVTGASRGIGDQFAEGLAARGADLLLVARSETRLLTTAADLAARFGVRVEIVTLDLVDPDGPQRLQRSADALRFEPDLLVNGADLDVPGPFADVPPERIQEMVRLNVEAPVALARLYAPRMAARHAGAIVNLGSTAAFGPLPGHAVYAASKAFVLSFGEALWAEQRRDGVRATTVCPDPADAGSRASEAGLKQVDRTGSRAALVAHALRAVESNEPVVVRSR